jgi:type III secretory pathway component EscU
MSPEDDARQPSRESAALELAARMNAVERLTKLFSLERMVHLSVTCISLVILIASATVMLIKGGAGVIELTGMFGSAGLVTISASRLLVMWNQALRLLAGETTGSQP